MLAWWESLSLISQIFACVAIPTTVVLLIQTILMFIGIGDEAGEGFSLGEAAGEDISDMDMEPDVGDGVFGDGPPEGDLDPTGLDGLRVFTVRGIIAFFVVFGWVGMALDGAGAQLWLTIAVATVCGFAMMLLLAFLLRTVMKLRNDGNLDNRNAVGTAGRVYLTVPASRGGEGKVNVLLQGTYVEREAVTDEEEPIPTGSEVVVTGLSGQTTLVVKRK
ncbi:MAG: hypothetical protein IKA63_03810 [Clostridia bacterium]|nr:hypothetical protein [Clostridia bacterium]